MNDLEQRAYGKIAQALAERAFSIADGESPTLAASLASHFPDAPRPIFRQSVFKYLGRDLWRLRILRPLDPTEKNSAYHFAFECDVKEADHIAERNWEHGPSLPELLETFIFHFENYGKEYHDFSSEIGVPFGRNGRLTSVLDALALIHYVEKTAEGYVWTDADPVVRVLDSLRSAYPTLWPSGGQYSS
ncbi:hypothetical protein ACFQZO_01715 [Bradyrhizobium sp. GCM10027634]|uniref:hypothetical protein n=1 Tax=unclassified Bradyrhizobium TaxID=2631580 RepID=UPI00188BF414|nr:MULTISPECIES: hypothetical protein [unclassified Bradyrhizobium]MDN4999600.1 hypothetical protein [Bradyrhizobium sp. WYCCWR 12677]